MDGRFGKYGDVKRKAQIRKNPLEKKNGLKKLRTFCTNGSVAVPDLFP